MEEGSAADMFKGVIFLVVILQQCLSMPLSPLSAGGSMLPAMDGFTELRNMLPPNVAKMIQNSIPAEYRQLVPGFDKPQPNSLSSDPGGPHAVGDMFHPGDPLQGGHGEFGPGGPISAGHADFVHPGDPYNPPAAGEFVPGDQIPPGHGDLAQQGGHFPTIAENPAGTSIDFHDNRGITQDVVNSNVENFGPNVGYPSNPGPQPSPTDRQSSSRPKTVGSLFGSDLFGGIANIGGMLGAGSQSGTANQVANQFAQNLIKHIQMPLYA